jgi:hypothetical protein
MKAQLEAMNGHWDWHRVCLLQMWRSCGIVAD